MCNNNNNNNNNWGKLLIKETIDIICLCAFVGISCSIKQKCTVNAT
jgi:hypothetical protein